MSQKNIILILITLLVLTFDGLIIYKFKYADKSGSEGTTENWQWEDDWGMGSPPPLAQNKPEVQPVVPDAPKQQLIVGSYQEALQKSGELGKPIMIFFTAEWCSWCKKMKAETMSNGKVQEMLKNYILVYVNTDNDRATATKFRITSLPSFVITNVKEEKLKEDSGFKNASSFVNWLNEPKLFNQPKSTK
jgi:thiol:disulfide interchange protein